MKMTLKYKKKIITINSTFRLKICIIVLARNIPNNKTLLKTYIEISGLLKIRQNLEYVDQNNTNKV